MHASKVPTRAARRRHNGVQDEHRLSVSRTLTLLACVGLLAACVSTSAPTPTAASPTDSSSPAFSYDALTPSAPQYCSSPGANTLASVVRVASADGNDASGVVIASNRVLTAAHVVTDHTRALVFINDHYRNATIVARDAATDLAILAVETAHLQPIELSDKHLLQSEQVWTVGFPLALDQVANAGFYQNHVDGAIYASAATNAGASGGGLLRCEDGKFELAGMIRGYGAYWRGGELLRIKDLSISVPADTINEFVMRAGVVLADTSRF